MFQFLLATSGALPLLMYMVITVSLLFMRRRLVAIGQHLEVACGYSPG